MFFILSKIIGVLLLPLPMSLALMLFAIFRYGSGTKKRFLLFVPWAFLFTFSTTAFSQCMLKTLESQFPPANIQDVPPCDAIVVLGGMIHTLTPNPIRPELNDSADRLIDAVRLYKMGKAKKILFTGGSGELFHPEAKESRVAEMLLLELGIPAQDIVLESDSRNTYENALFSKQIIQREGWKSITLITSAFHMKRSAAIFQKQGISFFPYATDYKALYRNWNLWEKIIPNPYALENVSLVAKEWLGILAYTLQGYL